MEPFFSVVIPVYNRAKALRAAILSVHAQSCQDFEIVVVDDGSRDNPAAVVECLGDPRVHFIRQDNAGGGAARNTGIAAARGRFVAFLDSDDVFLPHHLANMKALLDGTTDLVGYARVRVDRGEGRTFLKPPRAIGDCEDMATYLLCDRGFTPTSTLAMPREAASMIGFDEHLRVAEDTDIAIRLSLAGYHFRMLEAPGAVWADKFDPNRLSSSKGSAELCAWLMRLKPRVAARAWHGARGWSYAKLVVREQPLAALGLYLNAVLRGCYRPGLAGIIFLQIFVGRRVYRRIADLAIGRVRAGLRERKLEQA